jgi:hypothetical protein
MELDRHQISAKPMKTLPQFGHLSAAEQARFDKIQQEWCACAQSTERIDRLGAELDVQSLYAWFGKPAPKIIWCQSPWQMACLYLLVRMQLADREPTQLSKHLLDVREQLKQTFSREFADGTVSHMLSNHFPINEVLPKSAFFQDRIPKISPLLKPAGSNANLIFFAPGSTINVGYSGHSQIRRRIDDYRQRGGLAVIPQVRAQWMQKLAQIYADECTQAALRHYSGWGFGQRTTWPLVDFLREHNDNFYAQSAAVLINLIWFGSWVSEWCPIYDFLLDTKSIADPTAANELSIWLDLARNATAYAFFDKVCLVSERPVFVSHDANGRLHADLAPALQFADGYEIYSWHGVTCEKDVIEHPERLTPADIDNEENIEIKRAKMGLFGIERYLTSSAGTLIHQDEWGTLYSKPLGHRLEPLTMVRVKNSTPEPDGTYKEYFLGVPPTMATAREAVAWTFDMDEDEYDPRVET